VGGGGGERVDCCWKNDAGTILEGDTGTGAPVRMDRAGVLLVGEGGAEGMEEYGREVDSEACSYARTRFATAVGAGREGEDAVELFSRRRDWRGESVVDVRMWLRFHDFGFFVGETGGDRVVAIVVNYCSVVCVSVRGARTAVSGD
jgi:hypothetical protein